MNAVLCCLRKSWAARPGKVSGYYLILMFLHGASRLSWWLLPKQNAAEKGAFWNAGRSLLCLFHKAAQGKAEHHKQRWSQKYLRQTCNTDQSKGAHRLWGGGWWKVSNQQEMGVAADSCPTVLADVWKQTLESASLTHLLLQNMTWRTLTMNWGWELFSDNCVSWGRGIAM